MQAPGIKRLFHLLFYGLTTASLCSAQPSVNSLGNEKRAFITSRMDSLEWMVSSGRAESSGNQCRLPEHQVYFVPHEQIYFSKMAVGVTGKKKDAYIEMYVLNELALHHYFEQDYERSTAYWAKALGIAKENGFLYEELHMYMPALNNNYFLAGDYNNAMRISSEGLSVAEKLNDTNRVIHFSNVLGYIHMKQKNFAQAGEYFSTELKLSREAHEFLTEAHALFNLADLAIAQQEFDKALDHLQQSLALYHSYKGPGLFTMSERQGYIFNKMAEAYKRKGAYDTAAIFVQTAVTNAIHEPGYVNDYDEAAYFANAADIYNRLDKTDSALILARMGLVIAKKIIHRELIRDASEQLAIAFGKKKQFDSAYVYLQSFGALRDSIEKESNQQEILQREADLKIRQQQELQQIALGKQKRWRNIIAGAALFVMITFGFLYNRYRLRQENRYQQQLNKQQNELFNAIAVTQDQERKRIAEDIHDSLGSILSATKLKLSALKESQADQSEAQVEKYQVTMQLLDEASTELRNISHNIMPATLSKLGLVAALRNLISNISSHSNLQINFSTHDFAERVDEKTEMSVYRILLELVNNIVKHSGASSATVQLIRYPDYINITVEDNGKGFNYEQELHAGKGIGLGNIASRVKYLSGTMNVDAVSGRGTTVIIDIPYEQPKYQNTGIES